MKQDWCGLGLELFQYSIVVFVPKTTFGCKSRRIFNVRDLYDRETINESAEVHKMFRSEGARSIHRCSPISFFQKEIRLHSQLCEWS